MALVPRSRALRQTRPPPRTTSSPGDPRCHGGTYGDTFVRALAAAFSTFGAFLATHQTLSLMSTGLLICSLLSPAIILTFSPSGSIFDLSASAITRRGRGEMIWELDGLRREGLVSTEEDVCWDRVRTYYDKTGREGGGRRIRVEQVLIPVVGVGGIAHRGTITKGVLHRTLRVQHELERRLLAGQVDGSSCLQTLGRDGGPARCAVLSPVGWWQDEQALLRDDDVHRTLSAALSVEPSSATLGLPLTLSESFVGVGRDRQGIVKSAQQLVITFFLDDGPFPRSPALPTPTNFTRYEESVRDAAAQAWRQAIHDIVDHQDWPNPISRDPIGIATASKGPARHVLLKFLPHLTVAAHPRRLENVIYGIGYLLVTLYVWRYIRKLRAHSKMGLLVTGIVELAASGIMSVSICWLMGWDLGLVPWNLLAFLVLTSGLDNMILVLHAIANTDVNLPVPQRMSVGLRTVGVEMTVLLAVEELMALGLLWWVEISVMREWIRFGAVVLVVDYILELTFFSTVLSIDIQRLELADLLVQNPAAPYQRVPFTETSNDVAQASNPVEGTFRQSARSAWKVLRRRPAKTATVAFLWFINVILWTFYGSEHYLPAACSHAALSSDRPFLAPSLSPAMSRSLRHAHSPADPASSSYLDVPAGAGAVFWNLINPANATSVQVYLEPPMTVQFFTDETLAAPESLDLLSHGTQESSLFTKATLVVLPIAVVMALLYLLLLYLLKDAELLQAHWGSEERLGGPERRKRQAQVKQRGPEAGVELVKTQGPTHVGDVELVASGRDVVVSWAALERTLHVRKGGRDEVLSTFNLEVASSDEYVSLVALAVDPEGRYVAAATASGHVRAWPLERSAFPVAFERSDDQGPSPIVALLPESESASRSPGWGSEEPSPLSPPAPPTISVSRSRTPEPAAPAMFFSLHRNGSVMRWDCSTGAADTAISAHLADDGAPLKRWLVRAESSEPGSHAPLLALAPPGGRLHLISLAPESAGEALFDQVVTEAPGATVTALAVGTFAVADLDAPRRERFVAIGTSVGSLSLYTMTTPAARLGDPVELGSPIRQIRLIDAPLDQTCSTCGETLVDGFVALVSTRTTLRALRVFTPPTSAALEPCACNTGDVVAVARSRSSSTGAGLGSPIMSRTFSSGVSAALSSAAAGGRRFSPRKKPLTPTRPAAFHLNGDSPLRPRLPPPAPSGESGSSSGSGSPAHERSAPPLAMLAPPRKGPSPQASPTPASALLLPYPGGSDAIDAKTEPSDPESTVVLPIRVAEVASVQIDERSGWDVLAAGSGSKVAGLRRRRRVAEVNGERGWEVWTFALGRAGAPFDEGYDLGTSPLERVLAPLHAGEGDYAGRRDEGVREEGSPAGDATTHRRKAGSTLRRRLPPTTRTSAAPAASMSSRRLLAGASTPSVQFSPSTAGNGTPLTLPFSCARPVSPALGGSVLAVGLGNELVLLKAGVESLEGSQLGRHRQSVDGFLAWT